MHRHLHLVGFRRRPERQRPAKVIPLEARCRRGSSWRAGPEAVASARGATRHTRPQARHEPPSGRGNTAAARPINPADVAAN